MDMAYKFSPRSVNNLAECHSDIISLALAAIKRIDFTVICGHRGKREQNEKYTKGLSKIQYPNGDHNTLPSLAFDFIPYPFRDPQDWDNTNLFRAVINVLKEEAEKMGIVLECGIDYVNSWDAGHVALKSKNGIPYERTYAPNDN